MSKTKKKKIKYGKTDLVKDEDFLPENVKFRVTMFIPMAVLGPIRTQAKKLNMPYQTYINQILRERILGAEDEKRIREIVRDELRQAG